MWESVAVPLEDDLRQGDLLETVVLPAPRGQVPDPDGNGQIQVTGRRNVALVVGQCCTVERSKAYALAPVALSRRYPLDSRYFVGAQITIPPDPLTDTPYVYEMFNLEPVQGVLAAPEAGRLWLADFTAIQTLKGDSGWLRQRRVRRMTPRARRGLRFKLMLFWGRPERTDEDALIADEINPRSWLG